MGVNFFVLRYAPGMRERNGFGWGIVAVITLAALAASAPAAWAQASAAYKKFKGQIIVSDQEIPADWESDQAMVAGLKKLHRTKVAKQGETWRFYFMGFLQKKAGAPQINLVFYDVSKKRTYVSNKEINIDPGSNIVVADVEVSEEDGIQPGKTYEVVLGRMVGGKETVFARTKLTFK